ncbi:MAG TPA: tetratricopeptide repeat protein [Polyangia bacterium]
MAEKTTQGLPPGDGAFEQELDDWASAIDEWDANLALPATPVPGAAPSEVAKPAASAPAVAKPSSEKPPLAKPPSARPPAPTPAVEVAAAAPSTDEEPPPLEAAPLATIPEAPLAEDDPLMHLFDGEMELPEEAGEALGSLLGEAPPEPPAPIAAGGESGELELEASFAEPPAEESTRVAEAAEVAALLEDIDLLAPDVDPASPLVDLEPPAPAPTPASGLGALPESAARPLDDFQSAESTRVAAARELDALLELPTDEPPPGRAAAGGAALLAVEPDLDVDLDIIVSVPPPADEEDFYDDISVEPGREEPAEKAVPELREDEPASEPILVDPPLYAPVARSSDPDRTPLPISDDLSVDVAPAVPMARLDSRPVEAIRVAPAPLPAMPQLAVPETAEARPLDAAYLQQQLALYDTERLLEQDGVRAARLACAAARAAERLGDAGGARERYQAALEHDSSSLPALRGLRRLRLAAGDELDQVVAMLGRERERSSAVERRALSALEAELHLRRGDRDLAREGFRAIVGERPGELSAALGLCDVAAGDGDLDALGQALGGLEAALESATGATRFRAALAVERGRLDEAAGRGAEAQARFSAALTLDPQAAGAAWGLLRVALRKPASADAASGAAELADSHARLVELLPRAPLRAALERRLGLLRARAGDSAAARPALLAASDSDALGLRALVELERAGGRVEEAISALSRLVELETDPGRRADLRFTLGELHEERGNTALATDAYQRAAAEYPGDPRAERALERTHAAGGDKESALERHLRAAERDPSRAPLSFTRAARLLDELGRRDEALARLGSALGLKPGFAPAVELAAELHLLAGHPEEAAAVLVRAAEDVEDPALAGVLRERAARLYHRIGRRDEALAALGPLLSDGAEVAPPVRWLEARLLAGGDPAALAINLEAQARTGELTDRALAQDRWHHRGLVLAPVDADGALDSQRRALALDAGAGPASVELAARLLRAGEAAELPAVYQARRAGAEAERRPEAVALALRHAVSLADDAGDLTAARAALSSLPSTPARDPSVDAELTRLERRSGDDLSLIEVLERELAASAEAPIESRFALLVTLAERFERLKQPEQAVPRYRQALELRPGHPVAQSGLERALRATRSFSALADLALSELKEAEEPRRKVAAYEKLAFIDGELRGDRESALFGFQSIIEIDHSHHSAMRVLERQYLQEGRFAELIALYEQMGLTATDPTFAAAVHLDRARLRPRVQGEVSPAELEAAIDNDHRLALFKDGHSRPALRHLYGRARQSGDLAQAAELAARLADAADGDGRTAAVCLTRAGEALSGIDRPDEAKARLFAAVERGGLHLPALINLRELGLARGDFATAADAAEREGQVLRDVDARASAWLLAGAIADEKLADRSRALADYRQALATEPRSREAFDRQRALLTQMADHAGLAELYQSRLEVETDGLRLAALHLALARLARDHLGDRSRARAELQAVLAQGGAHPEALAMLAELYYDDEKWTEAAETLIKRARVEKDRVALKQIFFKLGLIYTDKLPDPKRAIACFARVVKADPNDLVAFEHLSNLSLKEWDWRGALEATRRLVELEKDPQKRIAHLHRIAKIHEEGFKDARHAHEALKAALDLDPMHVPSVGELARFFDRQSDVQSMRVHLDRTIARVRQQLEKDPRDAAAYHALYKIFLWRRAPDRAAMAAGVLDYLGAADAEEKATLAKLAARDGYPGSALADPTLDETLFDARVPAGFRHLFRLLDEPLRKMFPADLRRLNISKQERLPSRGHAVRDLANRIAADLGVRDFDLYFTAAHPTALMIELTDPLSIVIGQKLVEGAHELEVRFLLARSLKMIQSRLALPMRLTADDLGVLVGAIVRQFVPDFVPSGFEEQAVASAAARMTKLVPKKLQGELFPFAMECANQQLDLKRLAPALVDTANRAGLLACGLVGPPLAALERIGDPAQLRTLLRFAVSEELSELRRLAGTSLG